MNINIQIIGTPKCRDTAKAVRFFKERGLKIHFVDLYERFVSPGELDNILHNHNINELIDTNSKEYKNLNLQYMVYNEREMLLEHPLIIVTPIVRNGKQSTVGYQPEIWKKWIDESRE